MPGASARADDMDTKKPLLADLLISPRLKISFIASGLTLVGITIVGTVGYRYIGGPQYSLIDCFYMTFLTVATIGFGEIIDLSNNPAGRLFTVFIGLIGIGAFSYLLSTTTAFILEGDMNLALRRRRMTKQIDRLRDHYIICGVGRVGGNVAHELAVTERQFVAIDEDPRVLERFEEKFPEHLYLLGDGSDDETLIAAGIQHAAGVFAVTGDDNRNIVISLTARQLNPTLRVVARCHEVRNIDKAKKAGADSTVSPDFTGGLRIASAMVRPAVVTFMDEMLKSENNLRVEEIEVPESFGGKRVEEIVPKNRDFLLVAVREQGSWQFNPEGDFFIKPGQTLIVIANPLGRQSLEKLLTAGH
jgi:voltage-gated potassium channel